MQGSNEQEKCWIRFQKLGFKSTTRFFLMILDVAHSWERCPPTAYRLPLCRWALAGIVLHLLSITMTSRALQAYIWIVIPQLYSQIVILRRGALCRLWSSKGLTSFQEVLCNSMFSQFSFIHVIIISHLHRENVKTPSYMDVAALRWYKWIGFGWISPSGGRYRPPYGAENCLRTSAIWNLHGI